MQELLTQMGGWPVTLTKWNENAWSWQKMVKDLPKNGFFSNYIFKISIDSDKKNSSKRVISVRQSDNLSNIREFKLFVSKLDQTGFTLNRDFLVKGPGDKMYDAYLSYQIDLAVLYGANRSAAEVETKAAFDFEFAMLNVIV